MLTRENSPFLCASFKPVTSDGGDVAVHIFLTPAVEHLLRLAYTINRFHVRKPVTQRLLLCHEMTSDVAISITKESEMKHTNCSPRFSH
jgi:hypothetical protein